MKLASLAVAAIVLVGAPGGAQAALAPSCGKAGQSCCFGVLCAPGLVCGSGAKCIVPLPPPPVVPALPPPLPRSCNSGCDVGVAGRAAVFLNDVVTDGDADLKLVYQFLQDSGSRVTHGELASVYLTLTELSGSDLTPDNLRATLLDLEQNDSIEAIDLIISMHGDPDVLTFPTTGDAKVLDLGDLIASDRRDACMVGTTRNTQCELDMQSKLRIVYSAACYGRSHIAGWQAAGFAASAGAIGVHADSAASYPTFLNTWARGYTFAESVDRANSADSAGLYDLWAKLKWPDANSHREYHAVPSVNASSLAIWTAPKQRYLYCGQEDSFCALPAVADVLFGTYQTTQKTNVTGGIWCTNSAFGSDPAVNKRKFCRFTPFLSNPQSYFCANENGTCYVSGTVDVSYGTSSKKTWRHNVTAPIGCNNSTFGDPAYNESKSCSYSNYHQLPNYTFCAREGGQCSFPGYTKEVAFGSGGAFYFKSVRDRIACNTTEFGDPAPDVPKSCYVK